LHCFHGSRCIMINVFHQNIQLLPLASLIGAIDSRTTNRKAEKAGDAGQPACV
jgi:hypothetical protein